MTLLLESRVSLQLQVGKTVKETFSVSNRHHRVENRIRLFSLFLDEAWINRSILAFFNIIVAWMNICEFWKSLNILHSTLNLEKWQHHRYLWFVLMKGHKTKSMLILIIIVHVQPLTCTRRRDVDKNGSSVRNPDTLKHSANDNRSCRLSQVGLVRPN